jgi:hypothetical protein
MAFLTYSGHSCGVHLMEHIDVSTPESCVMTAFKQEINWWRPAYDAEGRHIRVKNNSETAYHQEIVSSSSCAFILFSTPHKTGPALRKYIEDNSLGTVIESPPAKNPNSGNTIRVWVWMIDHMKLKQWAKHRNRSTGLLPNSDKKG